MHGASGSNRQHTARGPVAATIRVGIATLYLAVHGCDTGTGGAVELSWTLRPASSAVMDKFVDCDSGKPGTGNVAQIRLFWQVDNASGDPTGTAGSQAWSCGDHHGVTGFDLAPGTANLRIAPECQTGPASPDSYTAPAIVQRQVSRGDTVSLGAVELVVAVSDCGTGSGASDAGVPSQPCICAPDASP
jgi:hypothetical protein